MNFRFRLLTKIAQDQQYLSWANSEITQLQQKFPQVHLQSFQAFKTFLDSLLPKLIHKYMLLSGSMKVCSGISPDFAEIAATNGFPVFVERIPNHMRNILLTIDGPYIIDLSYIQFLCKHDLTNPYDREEAIRSYKELYKDPNRAIRIEKLPISYYTSLCHPHGQYDNLYDPVKSMDRYDIDSTEEFFPERFKMFRDKL